MAARQQVSEMKANADPILQETDLTQMRQDFSMVSENLYPFLKTIGYEGQNFIGRIARWHLVMINLPIG